MGMELYDMMEELEWLLIVEWRGGSMWARGRDGTIVGRCGLRRKKLLLLLFIITSVDYHANWAPAICFPIHAYLMMFMTTKMKMKMKLLLNHLVLQVIQQPTTLTPSSIAPTLLHLLYFTLKVLESPSNLLCCCYRAFQLFDPPSNLFYDAFELPHPPSNPIYLIPLHPYPPSNQICRTTLDTNPLYLNHEPLRQHPSHKFKLDSHKLKTLLLDVMIFSFESTTINN